MAFRGLANGASAYTDFFSLHRSSHYVGAGEVTIEGKDAVGKSFDASPYEASFYQSKE